MPLFNKQKSDTSNPLEIVTSFVSRSRGLDVSDFCLLNNGISNVLACCHFMPSGRYLGMVSNCGTATTSIALPKLWRSSTTAFDLPSKKKLLKKFTVKTETDIKVTFYYDGKNKEYNISGGSENQEIEPNFLFKNIAVEITCQEATACITNPQLVVGFYE